MNVRIEYQGKEGSPWMREYMEGKVTRLERYLSPGAEIVINLMTNSEKCIANLSVKTLRHVYSFRKDGGDFFEAFTSALEEAAKILRRDQIRLQEKMYRKFDFVTEA